LLVAGTRKFQNLGAFFLAVDSWQRFSIPNARRVSRILPAAEIVVGAVLIAATLSGLGVAVALVLSAVLFATLSFGYLLIASRNPLNARCGCTGENASRPVSWRGSWLPLGCFVVAGLSIPLAIGCGDDESETTAADGSRTDTQSATPTTGVGKLDEILLQVQRQDADELVRLVAFADRACESTVTAIGGGPECPPGVSAGTRISAVDGGRCQQAWLREDQASEMLAHIMAEQPRVFAVGEWEPQSGGAETHYTVVLTDSPLFNAAPSLTVTADGIVGIQGACSATAKELADAFSKFLIPPVS
jgi:hypothetical protein